MEDMIKAQLKESSQLKLDMADKLTDTIKEISLLIIEGYKNNKKVVFFGNGGSAADSQHLAGEFVSKFKINRRSLPSLSLTVNTSILTSIGNDFSYDEIFSKQVEGLVGEGDIVIGIRTSGNSENVIRAFDAAKENGAITIAFTGESGGRMRDKADILLNVPSSDTPRIQEGHITAGHIICDIVESSIFGDRK